MIKSRYVRYGYKRSLFGAAHSVNMSQRKNCEIFKELPKKFGIAEYNVIGNYDDNRANHAQTLQNISDIQARES